MALIVQKFGGSSVANAECICHVADIIANTVSVGHKVVVVVSAMGGETDRLIALAKSISQHPNKRELDALLASGELVSSSLLSMSLIEKGLGAISFNAAQVAIRTNSAFTKARIESIDDAKIRAALANKQVVIVAGFQGIDSHGNITTLGRGGSDTTAVALAARLEADECQIYTDVEGVFTTDPRVEPRARRLPKITFEEMLELSSLGAKVLQIRAVEFAGRYKIPIRVLSTFTKGPGTFITLEDNMEKPLVSGIAFSRDEAKLTLFGVPDKPGIAAQILCPISEANIDIDMISQNFTQAGLTDFSFTVTKQDYDTAYGIVSALAEKLKAKGFHGEKQVAKLSLVGVGMRSHAGIASTMFKALGEKGINIHMVTTSEIKVSVLVDEKALELSVKRLHEQFGLEKEQTKGEKQAVTYA